MVEDVKYITFGQIANFRNGLNFGKESHGKGCLLIKVPDFKDRFMPDYQSIEEINPEGIAKVDDFLQEGDILFVRSNGNKALVGRSLYIDRPVQALFSGFCIRARIKSNDFDKKFCAYFTKSKIFKSQISSASGTNINNLNQDILSRVKIPHFQKTEQENIAAILSALDAKIEINNRINAELEAMAKTLYDYWFVQFDFPDENGKPYRTSGGKMVHNEILKREIPEAWEILSVGSAVNLLRRGITPKYSETHGVPILNQKCIRNQSISFEPCRRHIGDIKIDDPRLLKIGDILVNSTGVGTLGRVAYVKRLEEEKTLVDSHVTIVRANPEIINIEYFNFTLLKFQKLIEKSAEGSTGQVELKPCFLSGLNIINPDKSLQIRFSNILKPLIRMISKNEIELSQLTQLRDWLLPMLMNGQVTVESGVEARCAS